jgi:hypothetical protein
VCQLRLGARCRCSWLAAEQPQAANAAISSGLRCSPYSGRCQGRSCSGLPRGHTHSWRQRLDRSRRCWIECGANSALICSRALDQWRRSRGSLQAQQSLPSKPAIWRGGSGISWSWPFSFAVHVERALARERWRSWWPSEPAAAAHLTRHAASIAKVDHAASGRAVIGAGARKLPDKSG